MIRDEYVLILRVTRCLHAQSAKKMRGNCPLQGDADVYECSTLKTFKVAGTLVALQKFSEASTADWERALQKATQRAKQGEWPLIFPTT
jgi:hypothetical protein